MVTLSVLVSIIMDEHNNQTSATVGISGFLLTAFIGAALGMAELEIERRERFAATHVEAPSITYDRKSARAGRLFEVHF